MQKRLGNYVQMVEVQGLAGVGDGAGPNGEQGAEGEAVMKVPWGSSAHPPGPQFASRRGKVR